MREHWTWRCPRCRGSLETGFHRWSCRGCGAGFEAFRGIPDLRTRDDVYLDNQADLRIARRLIEDFDRRDFLGLLERYFDLEASVTREQRRRQVAHILSAPARARRWLDQVGAAVAAEGLLDLGCGSGSFLAAVGNTVPRACGVDIALRWLILARKRLDEAGLSRVPLVCACAEDLPLADASVRAVIAGDVIEHVEDQARTLEEAYRVLRPGGRLFLASPNRYSLAPEPHVGVWGVGYLPRQWMPRYVQMVRQVDFRAIRTLGSREWARLLRFSSFRRGVLTVPELSEEDLRSRGGLTRALGAVYNRVVRHPIGQRAGRLVGPLFHVVCEKPHVVTPTRPTRATLRRSMPPAA
ncbi:MAG: class I SAM-dependent methyltransferase [Isosphaeraceae bacterium]